MITNAQLVLFMLVLARVSAFVALFPLFSRKQLPSLVKVGLAASLSIFWFAEIEASSGLSDAALRNIGPLAGAFLMLKELVVGIVLAIALGLFFWPARIAGAYVGQELGLSLASISDPGSQDNSTLVTRLFETFAILIFFGINLHHFLIIVLHVSFHHLFMRVGVLELPTERLVTMLSSVGDYGLLVAAPLMILFMLVTVVLAFLNRAAPTLNLFSVGMSIRAGLGVFCLFLFCPILFGAIQTYLYRVQEDIEELIKAMG